MSSMSGEVKRGEIWLIDLDPTIGHEISKSRPGLIIQNDFGNKYGSTTIIAPVTSKNLDKIYPVEILINRDNSGLEKDSKILLNQIRTIDKSRLIKKLGNISYSTLKDVEEAIKISLGLINI